MPRHAAARNGYRAIPALVITVATLAIIASAIVPSSASVADPAETPTASTAVLAPVELGAAGVYSIMASTDLTAAGGSSAGEVGSSNSSIPVQAQQDLTAAYNAAATLTPTALISGDLAGRVITPGVYRADAALAMSATLTLDALGDPDAVFIFQVGAALNTTAASRIVLAHGAQASHVFWQVLGAVTTGANSYFVGTILGNAAITAGDGTTIAGRALTQDGAVTLSNVVALPVPSVALTSEVSPSVDVEAGDPVVFTDVIRNSGNVPIGVTLAAGLPSDTTTTVTWPDGSRLLAAGQSVTATTPYSPTLADAAARAVTARATVTGTTDSASFAATSVTSLVVHPTPVTDTVTTIRSSPVTFNVLSNDAGAESGATFSRASLGLTRRLVGGASGPVPASPLYGSVTCSDSGADVGVCTYQPAGSFTGTDFFDYSLTQGTRTWNVRVSVVVTDGAPAAPIARPVRVVATQGGPAVTFDPTANSTDPGTGSLVILSASSLPAAQGALSCTSTLCTFTPSASFTGAAQASYTEAEVSPSGVTGAASSPATISVFVDPPALNASGFVTTARTNTTVTIGQWAGSTTVSAAAACTAGRPSTRLSWPTSSGATSWVVQRQVAGAAAGNWLTVATLPGEIISYTDSALGEGNSYQWRVRPDLERWAGVFSAPSEDSTEFPAVNAFGC